MLINSNVLLTPGVAPNSDPATPLRDGDDVSWIHKCKVGDDQGRSSACTLFAIVNWVEIMMGLRISNDAAINTWKEARMRIDGNLNGGLSLPDAWYAANKARILPSHYRIERVKDLSSLKAAPIIGCYKTTSGWHNPNKAGCIRHGDINITGYHAVLIVGHGIIETAMSQKMVWIENSWSINWGYKGLGQMTEDYHRKYCKELWRITA